MNLEELFRFDEANMFDILLRTPQQLREAVLLQPELPLPDASVPLHHLVITGMGGSAVGGDLIAGLYGDLLDLPLIVNRDYRLPQFISAHSLVIACSYSGDTEETLAAVQQAADAGAPIVCIASGGKLAKKAVKNEWGLVRVPEGLPPRCALGYLFFALMRILQEYGIISVAEEDVAETIEMAERLTAELADYKKTKNRAVKLAEALKGRIAVIYAADEPNSALPLRWRNQLNENAKAPAFSNLVPEMNHNEICMWNEVILNPDLYHVIFLKDEHNSPELKERLEISRDLIAACGVPVTELEPEGESRLCRTFSLVIWADFVSYYLALLNGVDPTLIKPIDHLKREIANRSKE